jgi:hypothetical protein
LFHKGLQIVPGWLKKCTNTGMLKLLQIGRKASRDLPLVLAALLFPVAPAICSVLIAPQVAAHACCHRPATAGSAPHCGESGCVNGVSTTPPTVTAPSNTAAAAAEHVEIAPRHHETWQAAMPIRLAPVGARLFLKLHQFLI